MNKYQAIILMAGSGLRFSDCQNKTLIKLDHQYLFLYAVKTFASDVDCQKIFLVVASNDLELVQKIVDNELIAKDIEYIIGGNTRLASVQNALIKVTEPMVIIHDAARPLIKLEDIELVKQDLETFDATTLYEGCIDTYRYNDGTKFHPLKRNNLYKIVTPQGFKQNTYQTILAADNQNSNYTDEISILLDKNYRINHSLLSHPTPKLTYQTDLAYLEFLITKNQIYKIGHSFDFHPFVVGDELNLGGIKIPFNKKLKGWSDADVLYHAVAESIIGSLGIGDLGKLYPDNDPKYFKIASEYFLKDMKNKLTEFGYQIQNIDAIIYLEKPNLKKYKEQMAKNIATLLEISSDKVNVKATTMEEKGLVGKGEGIGAEAVTLIKLS